MKKLLSLIVIATLGFVSCSKDTNESFPDDVTGVWVLDSYSIDKDLYLKDTNKNTGVLNTEEDYNEGIKDANDAIGKEFGDGSIKFGENGTFYIKKIDDKNNTLVEWSVSEDIRYREDAISIVIESRSIKLDENDSPILDENDEPTYTWKVLITYIKSGSKLKVEQKNKDGKIVSTLFFRKL